MSNGRKIDREKGFSGLPRGRTEIQEGISGYPPLDAGYTGPPSGNVPIENSIAPQDSVQPQAPPPPPPRDSD